MSLIAGNRALPCAAIRRHGRTTCPPIQAGIGTAGCGRHTVSARPCGQDLGTDQAGAGQLVRCGSARRAQGQNSGSANPEHADGQWRAEPSRREVKRDIRDNANDVPPGSLSVAPRRGLPDRPGGQSATMTRLPVIRSRAPHPGGGASSRITGSASRSTDHANSVRAAPLRHRTNPCSGALSAPAPGVLSRRHGRLLGLQTHAILTKHEHAQ